MAQRKSLGRGLGALLPQDGIEPDQLALDSIRPNPDQPRKSFSHESLQELANSIKDHGLLQPILVKKQDDSYVIVAGERRWRAAALAGLSSIPVQFFHGSDEEILEISLVENLQREDLSALEIASSLKEMMKTLSLTQEEAARKISWSRSAVANKLRLLDLPDEIKELIEKKLITEGHGRALLSEENQLKAIAMAEKCVKEGWSVRTLEDRIRAGKKISEERPSFQMPSWGESLREHHIAVSIHKNRGKVRLTFSGLSEEQADKIGEIITNEIDGLFPGK